MSKAIITESHLTDIANAIIAKGGADAPLKPSEMAAAIAAIPTGPALPWPLDPDWPDIREIMRNNRHPTMPYAWIALFPPTQKFVWLYYSGGVRPNYLTSDGDTFYGDRYYEFSGTGYHWVIGRESSSAVACPISADGMNGILWMHYDDGFGSDGGVVSEVTTGIGSVVTGDAGGVYGGNAFQNASYIAPHALDNARFTSFYDTCYNNKYLTYFPDVDTSGADNFQDSFDGCTQLRRVTDTLDLMSCTTSTNYCFYNCIRLTNCPTRLKMNGLYGQTLSFASSPYIDPSCVAVIEGGVVVGGMAYNLNDLTGATNPPTVVFHENVKTAFGTNWQVVKDAFAAKGWDVSPA